jgi:hypothetical protein
MVPSNGYQILEEPASSTVILCSAMQMDAEGLSEMLFS